MSRLLLIAMFLALTACKDASEKIVGVTGDVFNPGNVTLPTQRSLGSVVEAAGGFHKRGSFPAQQIHLHNKDRTMTTRIRIDPEGEWQKHPVSEGEWVKVMTTL